MAIPSGFSMLSAKTVYGTSEWMRPANGSEAHPAVIKTSVQIRVSVFNLSKKSFIVFPLNDSSAEQKGDHDQQDCHNQLNGMECHFLEQAVSGEYTGKSR